MLATRLFRWLVCLPLMAAAPPVRAEDSVRATVLHIDGDEIVIDVGRSKVREAQDLTVYRTLEVRHPITHKLLRDRFVIGRVRVVQPGDSLSVTKVSGTPTHPLLVGDTVELGPPPSAAIQAPEVTAITSGTTPAPTMATPSAQAAVATAAAPPSAGAPAVAAASSTPASASPVERELLSYWYASLSQPPERRARLYIAYLQRRPDSPYRAFVLNEIGYLRSLDAKLARPTSTRFGASPAPEGAGIAASQARVELLPITSAEAGHDVELAALVHLDKGLRGLLLHVRPLEQRGYSSSAMEIDARGHARVIIPSDLVRAPGFAYFIETIDEHGEPHAAIGSEAAPKIAVVRGSAAKPVPNERATRVRFASEVVSFDGTSGRDYYLQTEGDFLYRVRRGALYGVRMGYGNLRGQGGTVQQLDVDKLDPQPAGFTYGFFEAELALHPLFGLALRGTIGLGRPDDPKLQRAGVTGGFQLRARIGEADGTHLILAGELMPEIGQRAYIGLAWQAWQRVPMSTEIVVTDQPVNTDELAVRLIQEIGYRFSDRVSIALRPSYQLRTIRHAGPGIGMAATFDW